ncbi:uncharacterized protein LOC141854869 isoform X2 [Brevipalpus obovatus]|uniref:uncharacterized protein LOC141854869 isoform X2 n=1 Tax=Brevipalpus obovatus TaxID=246614 RepID=UPI003D9FA136
MIVKETASESNSSDNNTTNSECHCESCPANRVDSSLKSGDNVVVQLYQEIENLKRQIADRDYHIVQMETSVMNHVKEFPNGEYQALQETLCFWQEKYDRLAESHRKLQKVNQALEDKLLRIVDKFETEKATLTRDVNDLTNRLVEARVTINDMEEENEQYKHDCNIAVNLLQCKPSNFVSYKVNTLPIDVQDRLRSSYNGPTSFNSKRRSLSIGNDLSRKLTSSSSYGQDGGNSNNGKVIRVPIPTFPPTAMVYSVNKVEDDNIKEHNNECPDYVSAAIMAKVLEERAKERSMKFNTGHQKCYQCRKRCVITPYYDQTTQTPNPVITNEDLTSYPLDYECGSYEKQISFSEVRSLHSDHSSGKSFNSSSYFFDNNKLSGSQTESSNKNLLYSSVKCTKSSKGYRNGTITV